MKNAVLCFLCLLSCLQFKNASAAKAAGGEVVYEWISDSTYRFIIKLYRDCSDPTVPSTMPLCFVNPCNATTNFSKMVPQFMGTINDSFQNGTCYVKTKCDSAASTLAGFKVHWYMTTVTLPARCNAWRVFTHINTRSATLNLANPTTIPLYVETKFNNQFFQGNSSPYFSVNPYKSFCPSVNNVYNAGAIDPDGDSLVTEVVRPLTGSSSMTCTDTAQMAAFASSSPAYAIPTNPFQTNGTFTLNAGTGQMSFTPALSGSHVLAIRVNEYRSGILIGYIMRDITINVSGNVTVGTDDVTASGNEVKVYPNPNDGSFYVAADAFTNRDVQLQIVNALGQIIHSENIKATSNSNFKINIPDAANGIYMLRISSADNIRTIPFQVQR